jgi:hypothetical protein
MVKVSSRMVWSRDGGWETGGFFVQRIIESDVENFPQTRLSDVFEHVKNVMVRRTAFSSLYGILMAG